MKYFGEIVNDKDLVTKEYVDRYAQLSGASFTGPVTFGNSVSIDEATIGDLVINGNASFTNNIQANTINGVEVGSTPKFTDTDTKVTSSANHYTPATASGNDKTASASGATAAWNIDVVKGITINTDGKGHITGLSVTSGKIPANPNTDIKVKQLAAITTAGAYPIILAYSTATTEETNSVNKTSTLTYNPNTKALVTGGTVDGYTLAAASAKSVVTSIDTSASLPTSNAVKTFVENKGYTTNTGTITQVKTTAGAHTTINVSSGAATFNVPTKTSHLTNDSGFLTSHQTLYEANLNWGGKNFSASYGPIDAAMIGQLGANRFAFLKAAGLTIEYSTDGGSSWTDYGATNTQKTGLFGYGQSFYLGKHTAAGSSTLNDQLRVTIATSAAGLYTTLNKIAIYMSTSGNTVQVKIERALESTPTTYTTHLDWTGISGWSGWNILNITGLTTYGNAPASQNGRVRFTFKQTAVTTTYSAASISQIMGFGGVGWSVPSNMARDGHLYKYDNDQNATFPAKVTATSFSGNLTGNVTGNVSGTAANVTGTVAIANGGTGQTTAANAINALLNGLPTWTADPTDSTYFIRQDTGGSATYGKAKASTIWNYISGKLPAWSKASTKPSYTFSEIGSKPTTISGYGITDAKIASGTITLGSNTITPLTSSSTLNAAKLSGAIPSAVTATTQTAGDNSTKIATTAFVSSAINGLPTPMQFIGTVGTNGTKTWANLPTAATSNEGHTYKVITDHAAETGKPAAKAGDTIVSNGSLWIVIPSGDETATQSATTGISIAAHGTGTVIGVQSSTTTASKVTVGSSSTDYGVKSAGSASNWVFEDVACDDITAWNAGSGSGSLTFTMDTTDTKKLKIAFSHSHTVPSLSYSAKTASHVKSGGNGTAPTLGSKVPIVSATDVTVPIKNASASTFVTGTTHTVTDNGHTHTI